MEKKFKNEMYSLHPNEVIFFITSHALIFRSSTKPEPELHENVSNPNRNELITNKNY